MNQQHMKSHNRNLSGHALSSQSWLSDLFHFALVQLRLAHSREWNLQSWTNILEQLSSFLFEEEKYILSKALPPVEIILSYLQILVQLGISLKAVCIWNYNFKLFPKAAIWISKQANIFDKNSFIFFLCRKEEIYLATSSYTQSNSPRPNYLWTGNAVKLISKFCCV